jgi:hypothetical protein
MNTAVSRRTRSDRQMRHGEQISDRTVPRQVLHRRGLFGRRLFGAYVAIVVTIATVNLATAADWIRPPTTGAPAFYSTSQESLRRLPPIESLSYDAARMAPLSKPPDSVIEYDDGLVISTYGTRRDPSDFFPFQMRVNSWLQLRSSQFDSDGPNDDQNTFSFERLRLSFAGHAFSEDLKYFFQFDGNSDRSSDTIFLDHFATYDVGQAFLGLDAQTFGFKAGKWKVPFSRSREESGRQLQFTDRATANIFFDLNRSLGVGFYGRLNPFPTPIHYETAVFNGFKTGGVSTNRDGGLDRNFGWSLRCHTDLLGTFGSDGEPDLGWHAFPAIRIGGAVAYTTDDNEGPTEFSRQRVVDSGLTLASVLPTGVDQFDVWLSTVDAHLKWAGCSLIGEYYWRGISHFVGGSVPDLFDHGFVLQSGYFVCPHKLELLVRWSRIIGDSGTLGTEEQSSEEFGTGFAWYFNGHNAKLVFDVSHLNSAPIRSARLDVLPGDTGWLFRTQLQLAF